MQSVKKPRPLYAPHECSLLMQSYGGSFWYPPPQLAACNSIQLTQFVCLFFRIRFNLCIALLWTFRGENDDSSGAWRIARKLKIEAHNSKSNFRGAGDCGEWALHHRVTWRGRSPSARLDHCEEHMKFQKYIGDYPPSLLFLWTFVDKSQITCLAPVVLFSCFFPNGLCWPEIVYTDFLLSKKKVIYEIKQECVSCNLLCARSWLHFSELQFIYSRICLEPYNDPFRRSRQNYRLRRAFELAWNGASCQSPRNMFFAYNDSCKFRTKEAVSRCGKRMTS